MTTYSVFSKAASFICLHLRELDITGVSLDCKLFHSVAVAVRYTQRPVIADQRQQVLFAPTPTLYLLRVFPQHRDFPGHKHRVVCSLEITKTPSVQFSILWASLKPGKLGHCGPVSSLVNWDTVGQSQAW